MTTKVPSLDVPLFYHPHNRTWTRIDPNLTPPPLGRGHRLEIFSWNLNCSLRHSEERVRNAITRIQRVYLRDYRPGQVAHVKLSLVVLLQGISATAIRVLKGDPFIRDNFVLSDDWLEVEDQLGCATLASQDLCIGGTFRVPFRYSKRDRDVVFVDVVVDWTSSNKVQVLRIANTQLESLTGNHGEMMRSIQLANIMDYLLPPRPDLVVPFPPPPDHQIAVVAGIVGGDFAAVEAGDAQLPHMLGFRDLWTDQNMAQYNIPDGQHYDLENCGKHFGHTWGYQPFLTTHVPRRLDKLLAVGDVAVEGKVTRVGVGNKVAIRRFHMPDDQVFVSDHFGLKCELRVGLRV